MAIVRRNLTVHFQRSVTVTSTDVVAQSVEVSVIPLQDASNAAAVATYVGGVQTANVSLLNEDNVVTFSLVPSNAPGLTGTINYRIMWRVGGVTGRTETYDFAMPDVDISFDELHAIGNIIGGEAYLQRADLGAIGRVAKLNDYGQVVDAFGVPVVGSAEVTALENRLTAEINTRLAREQQQIQFVQNEIESQINSAITSSTNQINQTNANFNAALTTERNARTSTVGTLTTNLTALQTTVANNNTSTGNAIFAINASLDRKADLDNGGKIPFNQIPPEAITNWIPLSQPSDRFLLQYPSQIQIGDIVLCPLGVWGLFDTNPALESSWYLLNQVQSVNGQLGFVQLTATDVGAIPVGGSIAQSQITGLSAALALLAPRTITTALQQSVDAIRNDTTIVKLNGDGVIPSSLLDINVAYINSLNQVTKKDGTVIGAGGGGSVFSVNGQTGVVTLTASQVNAVPIGGSIFQSQVIGLSTALANKADLSGGTILLSQIPSLPQSQVIGLSTALVNKADLSGGTVPLTQIPTLPATKVVGLDPIISNNGLTSSTNAVARIGALETLVASGGGGGGTGNGTASSTTVLWNSFNLTDDVTDFTTVTLGSPFGIYSTGPNAGQYYYNRNGVPPQDVAYPSVSPGGHLRLYKWNESNPSDPSFALASDLNTLSGNVSTLSTAVSSKASQSDLTTLQATVTGLSSSKADLSGGTVPLNQLPSIPQSQITGLSTTFANKADLVNSVVPVAQIPIGIPQANIANLATTFSGKADLINGVLSASQIPTGIPQASVANLTTALAARANLVNGTVPLNQLPSIPQSQVTDLSTTFAAKADIVNGTVPLSQVPTNIPQSSIANLATSFAGKANLDPATGALQLSQLPFVAVQRPQVVANRASMLALTTSQVHVGDLCLITSTSDQGAYTLIGSDPSVFTNWRQHPMPPGAILSISGTAGTIRPDNNGTVTLTPADIGALATNASIPQSQITNLSSTLSTFATTNALTTGLAGKASLIDVSALVGNSQIFRGRVDYAVQRFIDNTGTVRCNSGVTSPPSGTPIIDKDAAGNPITATNNALVLLTNQASSRENGVWKVNASGAWTRPADYASGTTVYPDTIVTVNNSVSTGGIGTIGASNYTVWQNYSTIPAIVDGSGTVNASTSWYTIGSLAPPTAIAAGNGIAVTGTMPNLTVSATAGLGLQSGPSGVQIDTASVVRKFNRLENVTQVNLDVTHNLGTTYPQVTVIENSSNNVVLVGWQVINSNQVRLEFSPTAINAQYRISVQG